MGFDAYQRVLINVAVRREHGLYHELVLVLLSLSAYVKGLQHHGYLRVCLGFDDAVVRPHAVALWGRRLDLGADPPLARIGQLQVTGHHQRS